MPLGGISSGELFLTLRGGSESLRATVKGLGGAEMCIDITLKHIKRIDRTETVSIMREHLRELISFGLNVTFRFTKHNGRDSLELSFACVVGLELLGSSRLKPGRAAARERGTF